MFNNFHWPYITKRCRYKTARQINLEAFTFHLSIKKYKENTEFLASLVTEDFDTDPDPNLDPLNKRTDPTIWIRFLIRTKLSRKVGTVRYTWDPLNKLFDTVPLVAQKYIYKKLSFEPYGT